MDWSSLPADTARRFRLVSDQLEQRLDPDEPARIIDVGGHPGTFARALKEAHPEWQTGTVDTPEDNLPDYMSADGADLPFDAESADAVVSIDTLEHVPPERREAFVGELCRVAKRFVVLAAPSYHPVTAQVEKMLDDLHIEMFAEPHPWLHEHVVNGLPVMHEITGLVPRGFGLVAQEVSYDLVAWTDWQILSVAAKALGRLDEEWQAYDKTLARFAPPKPHEVAYRHLLVLERGAGGTTPRPVVTRPKEDAGEAALLRAKLMTGLVQIAVTASRSPGGSTAAAEIEERVLEALRAAEAHARNSEQHAADARRSSGSIRRLFRR